MRPSSRDRRSALRIATRFLLVICLVVLVASCWKKKRKMTAISQPLTPVPTVADVTELKIEDKAVGLGAVAETGKTVTVHFTGWLANGTRFDSSKEHGRPFKFQLGVGDVIKGWDQGVVGMKVGGVRRLIIPPRLAYGENRVSNIIPPNATLVFDVELLGVE